jgi:hypothetical protein
VGHRWLYYNGVQSSEIGPGGKLSIHRWASRFVGQGVLIDAFEFRKAKGRELRPMDRDVFSVADLKDALESQGTVLKP